MTKEQKNTRLKILLVLFFLTILGAVMVFLIPAVIRSRKVDVSLIVRLRHPYAEKVEIYHNFDGKIKVEKMEKKNDYVYTYEGYKPEGDYQFNILATTNQDHERLEWVASEKGIYAGNVNLNGTTLNEYYLNHVNKYNGVGFNLSLVDTTVKYKEDNQIEIDDRIPSEMVRIKKYVQYETPPEGFTHAMPWLQALFTGENNDTAKIEVDYVRLYQVFKNGEEEILLANEYNYGTSSTFAFSNGRLYKRYPFFFDEKKFKNPMIITTNREGYFSFYPHQYKEWVWHWWGSKRSWVSPKAEYLKVEARIKITGTAVVQAGLDFWTGAETAYSGLDVNNTEAGASDIYFSSPDWQIINFSTKKND
ncbi:MAG: hypothetical protein GF349_00885 [Candidatus Magasanikbacteria bacterium]|nr:hypothetical protein [Candidatus Magasanikbacteria bacterium]